MQEFRAAVIDDETQAAKLVGRALEKLGFEVETFGLGHTFLARMAEDPFQLAFIDLKLPDVSGIAVLESIKTGFENIEAVIITGHASIPSAVEATAKGASNYIVKPFRLQEVRSVAREALEKLELREENLRLKEALRETPPLKDFLGSSQVMLDVFAMIRKIAGVNCNVLLQADTGTGKERAARAIHDLSPRKNKTFVSFNCGGFTEELISSELFGHEKGAFTGATATKIGLLESANGGTVFLDEIGEMPPNMQVKLLHVIQERSILRVGGTQPIELDIRIIAATNRDLQEAMAAGEFREDLFYRLNVVSIYLPTLAERKADIPLLANHFLETFNARFGKGVKSISSQAMEVLTQYNYPGNVRELENIVQRAVALAEGDVIGTRELPPDLLNLAFSSIGTPGLLPLEVVERRHIQHVLEATGYNKGLSCTILGIPRTTLWRRIKQYGLDAGDEE
ncbi:sigma-54-dependent transcriptional regulator [Pseudodesulfovibrio piezophilus]|uniref:Two component, sigma54 specific, transcriptional regulator, Fis family n=1 Tax=Pseudodesulfovibrio piezophilus (strain DSM 21447 / JCM 15486 / C1TLV30) TaxID=1322246 RepID=M1WU09_PSEP2|nr:sigma 54-interacting transcriptional regulator [Pseudodesulfovibrio piezophilus]CCH50082.1 Two component, sigma54 specific, transcriptional regulator, Fis family [Pseudodesulfovibrio piezophilus C1TLV30]